MLKESNKFTQFDNCLHKGDQMVPQVLNRTRVKF